LTPKASLLQIYVAEFNADRFRYAEPVPVGQQEQGVVTLAVAALLGRL